MSEAWRCFVALWLGPKLHRDLAASVARWRDRPDLVGVRWTDPAAWHVTLAFLGDIDPAFVAELDDRLRRVAAGHTAMRLSTGGLGAFPSPARARVAWYGVHDAQGRLASLAADVARAGGQEPDPFTGHVTLGRAVRTRLDLRAWVSEEAPNGTLRVRSFELVRSHPVRAAPHYEVLAAYPLGAGRDRAD